MRIKEFKLMMIVIFTFFFVIQDQLVNLKNVISNIQLKHQLGR